MKDPNDPPNVQRHSGLSDVNNDASPLPSDHTNRLRFFYNRDMTILNSQNQGWIKSLYRNIKGG